MNKKLIAALLAGAALLFGTVCAFGATVVKDSGVGVEVAVPEEMLAYFEAYGIDVSAFENGTSLPASVREDILALNRDEDTRAELNAMANKALRAARDRAGLPTYLQVGPLYWGYWTADDEEALGLE